MINSFINNYFGFNKQQRNGLMVLVVISFSLLLIRLIFPFFITPDDIVVRNIPMGNSVFNPDSYRDQNSKEVLKTTVKEKKLFTFDPNSVTHEQLLQLGFTEKKAHTFLKYRSSGFVFKEKEDLKKVFGVTTDLYSKLEPYIHIENLQPERIKKSAKSLIVKSQVLKMELNAADSSTLTTLNGIGPSYASRIIKYRNMLGGFVLPEQLKEVYGFNEELFQKVKDKLAVDPSLIKKLDLNKDDFKTINKHPYISYELTKSIFDWRRKTPITLSNLKDIVNDLPLYERLLPYLNF